MGEGEAVGEKGKTSEKGRPCVRWQRRGWGQGSTVQHSQPGVWHRSSEAQEQRPAPWGSKLPAVGDGGGGDNGKRDAYEGCGPTCATAHRCRMRVWDRDGVMTSPDTMHSAGSLHRSGTRTHRKGHPHRRTNPNEATGSKGWQYAGTVARRGGGSAVGAARTWGIDSRLAE